MASRTPDVRAAHEQASSRRSRGFTWGFVSQALSSATSLGLSVIAARALGPSGLGVVAISFGSYLAVLGLQRALITEPLVAMSAALRTDLRSQATRNALSVALLLGVATSLVVAGVGIGVQGGVGRALVVVAPWLPALVIQDFWRASLFRDRRPRAAVTNDAVWLLAMTAAVPGAWAIGTGWAIVGCWAVGGLAGAVLGFYQSRVRPAPLGTAVSWCRSELWTLGRWLALNSLVGTICGYALLFLLAAIVGTSALGGLKAVTTLFTPLSVIGSAIALPGLPALARARLASERAAIRLAVRIGLACVGLTALYVGLLGMGGGSIVPHIFGPSFNRYADLVWPVSASQMFAASAVGFVLLLKAQRRGRAVLLGDGTGWVIGLGGAAGLGASYGVTGAAWSITVGQAIGAAACAMFVRRPPAGSPAHPESRHTALSTGST